MIQGADIVIQHRKSVALALDMATRLVLRRWPQAVLVNGDSGRRFNSYSDIPFGRLSEPELLVYRDEPSFDSWTRLGADPTNANAMVHLIANDSTLTLVVDDPNDTTMASIIDEMKSWASGNVF